MNAPARSTLGVFYRSPLGVRTAPNGLIFVGARNTYSIGGETYNSIVFQVFRQRRRKMLLGQKIQCMEADSAGNILVGALSGLPTIAKYTQSGSLLWSWNSPESPAPKTKKIALAPDGSIYVAYESLEYGIGAGLLKFSPTGTPISIFLGSPSGYDLYPDFSCVAVDADGNIVVCGFLFYNDDGYMSLAKFNGSGSLFVDKRR